MDYTLVLLKIIKDFSLSDYMLVLGVMEFLFGAPRSCLPLKLSHQTLTRLDKREVYALIFLPESACTEIFAPLDSTIPCTRAGALLTLQVNQS